MNGNSSLSLLTSRTVGPIRWLAGVKALFFSALLIPALFDPAMAWLILVPLIALFFAGKFRIFSVLLYTPLLILAVLWGISPELYCKLTLICGNPQEMAIGARRFAPVVSMLISVALFLLGDFCLKGTVWRAAVLITEKLDAWFEKGFVLPEEMGE